MFNNYYDDKDSVSNSMVGNLLNDHVLFSKWMEGSFEYPTNTAFIQGQYTHHHWLNHVSNGRLTEKPPVMNVFNLAGPLTKKGKAERLELRQTLHPAGDFISKDDMDLADRMTNEVINNDIVNEYVKRLSGENSLHVEVPMKRDVELPFQEDGSTIVMSIKGKADLVFINIDGDIVKITDLKTTQSLHRFKNSVYKYGYDRQAYHYSTLFGVDMLDGVFDFIPISKDTLECKIYETDRAGFVDNCEASWERGMLRFVEWRKGITENLYYEKL